jgi:hypothetical protein
MSERNRELLNLFVVGMLTALGFASVYIARQSEVSTGSLSYAAFFFALYLVAHFVARYAVPNADPYLLPMAALLTAIGVTEIYRLNPDNAFKQGLWIVIAVGCSSRRCSCSGATTACSSRTSTSSAGRSSCRPAGLPHRHDVNGARLAGARPLQFQLRRAREAGADRLPGRVPPREAR